MSKRRSRGEGSIYYWEIKGLWVAKITLADGKRKTKYAKTQKEVREWLQTSLNQQRQGLLIEKDTITISEYINRFMEDVGKLTLRQRTIEAYSSLIRCHIIPELGSIKLTQLRPDHLQAFYSRKLESGLSRRTVQFIHSILHKALDQALRWGLVVRNVSDLVDPPKPQKQKFTVFTPEQVNIFLNSVKDHRWYLIYVLAIYCGFREGEILGIHIEDCDLKKGIIHVRHAVLSVKGGLVITDPKTEKSRRSVTVPSFALNVLRSHIEGLYRNQGLIFTTSTGKPVSPRNVIRHFKSALKKAELPNIRFHDLRHTSATLLLSAGVHPKVVQERLGHSQISLTLDTYSHVMPHLQDEAAEKMNEILSIP
jgi:integrase